MSDMHDQDPRNDPYLPEEGATAAVGEEETEGRGRRRLVAPAVLVGAAILLVIALVVALTALRGGGDSSTASAGSSTSSTSSSARPTTSAASVASAPVTTAATATATATTTADASPTETATAMPTSAPTATPTTTPPAKAAAPQLAAIAAGDAGRRPGGDQVAAYLQTRSVGQYDAYMVGPISHSHTWTADDILAYHQGLQKNFPGVVLFQGNSGKWVSAVTQRSWQTQSDAISWCQQTYGDYGTYATSPELRSR